MNDPVTALVLDLRGAGRARIRERARRVLFPRRLVLDHGSPARLARLTELCAAPDIPTRTSALRIVTWVLWLMECDPLPFDRIEADTRVWAGEVGRAVVRHLTGAAPDDLEAGVFALYWVYAQQRFPAAGPVTGDLADRLSGLMREGDRALRLAAAACVVGAGGGDGTTGRIFREFLASPPDGEITEVLGDYVHDTVRLVLDGHPEQIPIFTDASRTGDPAARCHTIAQCARIMETWRDAPARMVPVLAGGLTDESFPVRVATVLALLQSGRAAGDHLGAVGEFLREPAAGVPGSVPGDRVEMARAVALEILVAFRRPEAVEPLRAYLTRPYGNVSFQLLVADAAWCAGRIADDLAVHLRSGSRHRKAILNALRGWGGAAAPLLPVLVALHAGGEEKDAILEILAEMGPAAISAAELLHAELRDENAGPRRRSAAAAALIRCGTAIREAEAVLVAEFGHPAAQRCLATLPWSAELREGPALGGAAGPYAARISWQCGDRHPDLAADLLGWVGPLPGGLRALAWLMETGDLAAPHRPALEKLRDDPGRPGSRLILSRRVAADERFRDALTAAL